jgi:23S rRNA (cytidine1920-2'-O)/16S rRNA (cytidine1409-2'-O)-methyltransferase
VLDKVVSLIADSGDLLMLVKPQFEAGKERVGKKGVVRDPVVHEDVLADMVDRFHRAGLVVRGLTFSPVKGPEGNIEFWIWASRSGRETGATPADVVREAHETLGGRP